MVTQLRRKLKSRTARSIILWVILLTLSLGLLLTLVTRLFKIDLGAKGFVTVNGQEVSYKNFQMKVLENEQRMQLFRRYFGKEADKFLKQMGMSADPRTSALQLVVKQELLNQVADRLSLSLSSDFISQKLADPMFLQQEFGLINFQQIIDPVTGLNDEALRYNLRMMGLSITDFENIAVQAIKRDVLAQIASASAYVAELEIKDKYINDYLARKFSLLTFDFDSFLKEAKKKEVSKKELQAFYNAENKLKKRYWVPEKRSGIAYIFDPTSYGVVVEDVEIQRYYDDNKQALFVKEPAKVQVKRILFSLKDAQDEAQIELRGVVFEKAKKTRADLVLDPSKFESVAKELSEDKESAKNGGLLPMFSRGERNRELEKAAFLLKADGDISEVIETDEGYEIIQRAKREDAKFKDLKSVSGEIKNSILANKFKRLFSSDMSKLLSRGTFAESKLNELIKKAVKNEKIELQTQNEAKRSQALFRVRENIPAFYIESDEKDGKKVMGIVVKLVDVKKRHLPELSAIESVVTGDYYEKKASDALEALLKKAKIEAKTKKIEELKQIYGKTYTVTLEDTEWVKKNDTDKMSQLRSKGYPVENLFMLEKPGFTDYYRSGPSETSNGCVVKLNEIEKFNSREYDQKKDEIKNELAKLKNVAQFEEFIAFLRKKAKIKVDR